MESEIVNGITAGLAGATQCGIPLTLRGVSRGVTLVTAHTQDDSELNWRGLAQGGTTLVVYMGVARLQQIQEGLLSGDMPSDTPIAMIEQASTPQQRQHACRLDDLCEQAAAFKLQSPAGAGDWRGGVRGARKWPTEPNAERRSRANKPAEPGHLGQRRGQALAFIASSIRPMAA